MPPLRHLLEANRNWAARIQAEDPAFFDKLSRLQTPQYLWIGCSDSRVPANQITGLAPGEVFVHRNVANIVVHSDLNCLSVLQYAVDALKVRHVIVCGHYGCGGVRAALSDERLGLIDNWLCHIQDVRDKHAAPLAPLNGEAKFDRLCELNVIEQVVNVARTTILRDAWLRGQPISLHGWIYGLSDGRLRDLGVSISDLADIETAQGNALANLAP